jgi:RNA polymerase sigma factor (sigma-70 family)
MTVQEYNKCVDQFSDGVYRFILHNIKDKEEAQDVVQDTFEKLWLTHTNVNFEKSKSYIFTTAYRTMVDKIRRGKKMTRMEDEHLETMKTDHKFSDVKQIVRDAVSRLPEIQQSVIMLRDYEGYSYEEIGEITGLNESQVKVYIYQGTDNPEELYRKCSQCFISTAMNINRSNYEEVFIDYFDGNLAAEKVAELFLFLEKNPDLKEEFESFSGEPIPGFDEVFDNKEALKRGAVNSENIDYFLIGDIENNLTKSEQEQLQMFLKENPAFVKEHDLFKATIVAPDLSVKFPNKGNLRQPVPFAFNTNSIMRFAIAAVLLLMVIGGGYILFTKSSKPEAPVLAEDQPVDSAASNENSLNSERNFATNTLTPESNQKPEQVNNTSDQNANNTDFCSEADKIKSSTTVCFRNTEPGKSKYSGFHR